MTEVQSSRKYFFRVSAQSCGSEEPRLHLKLTVELGKV